MKQLINMFLENHIMILLAIAGTYTPICLKLMNNWKGYIILSIEWIMVIAGILLKSVAKKSYPKFSMTIYMLMGWLAIFILPTLIRETRPLFIIFIALVGIMYTLGTFFYSKPQKKFFHFILCKKMNHFHYKMTCIFESFSDQTNYSLSLI